MTRSCEVRVMRIAKAGEVIVRGDSDQATGELIDTETVTISSEEGRWKRAERHLAGGLSYRTYGSNGGVEETGLCRPRLDPIHLGHISAVALATLRCSYGRRGVQGMGARSTATEAGASAVLPPSSCSMRAPCGGLATDPVSRSTQSGALGCRRGPHRRRG
jgi:hypothetical protein